MVEITYQMLVSTLQTVGLLVGIIYYIFIMRNIQKTYAKFLKHLNENTDLNDPENVERYVFNKKWKNIQLKRVCVLY
jgi:hypothetical protein